MNVANVTALTNARNIANGRRTRLIVAKVAPRRREVRAAVNMMKPHRSNLSCAERCETSLSLTYAHSVPKMPTGTFM